jgi:hypothetical protein
MCRRPIAGAEAAMRRSHPRHMTKSSGLELGDGQRSQGPLTCLPSWWHCVLASFLSWHNQAQRQWPMPSKCAVAFPQSQTFRGGTSHQALQRHHVTKPPQISSHAELIYCLGPSSKASSDHARYVAFPTANVVVRLILRHWQVMFEPTYSPKEVDNPSLGFGAHSSVTEGSWPWGVSCALNQSFFCSAWQLAANNGAWPNVGLCWV